MILYHGTNIDFEEIDLMKSKPNNDFGRGFYLSPLFEQAKDMKAYMVNKLAMMLLEIVFNSDTYQKMMNDKTRLYYQSPMYVFAFLDQELKLGKLK